MIRLAYYNLGEANERAVKLMRCNVAMWRRPSKHVRAGFVYYVLIP